MAGDVFSLAAVLPWWAGVVMAIVAYAVLHRFAVAEVSTNVAPGQVGQMVAVGDPITRNLLNTDIGPGNQDVSGGEPPDTP